jgi:hypothetical protein
MPKTKIVVIGRLYVIDDEGEGGPTWLNVEPETGPSLADLLTAHFQPGIPTVVEASIIVMTEEEGTAGENKSCEVKRIDKSTHSR